MDKERILEEVRRCAAENGGRPLGRERFERVTGIRETDWAGKYWINWSEAIQEAGFSPNAMNQPYDDTVLLEHLAQLVRELGRFPVSNELRMARRTRAEFPSPNTFRRLGGKADLARRLLQFCESNPGYEDVATHCREVVQAAITPTEDVFGGGLVPGWVYLVKSGQHYKIGRTNSLGRREYEIGLQLPEKLELIHAVETDDVIGIERYWHDRFGHRRANGEWFKLSAQDVRSFKKRRTFM